MLAVTVQLPGGDVTLDAWEYAKGVLPAEMPAEWPEDALKAQTVAIVSYALAAGRPLYPDQRDQVYAPSKRTARTDGIVEAMRGLVAMYGGQPARTFYSAACGGHTENSWAPAYLRRVPCVCGRERYGHGHGLCQWGARRFAEQGWSWQQILGHYYSVDVVAVEGDSVRRLVGAHVQSWRDDVPEVTRALGSGWVKVMDPVGGPDPMPEARKVIRFWTDDWDRALMDRGEEGARLYMEAMRPRWDRVAGWSECVLELPNEPDPNLDALQPAWVAFTLECMRIARAWGLTLVAGNWPEGNPSGSAEDHRRRVLAWKPVIEACIEQGMIWSQHGYWKPGVCGPEDLWHANAFYRAAAVWVEAGVPIERLRRMATEVGLDGLVSGGSEQGHYGWQWYVGQGRISRAQYIQDVVAYNRFNATQAWAPEAVFQYNVGSYSPGESYDHSRSILLEIAAALPERDAVGDAPIARIIAEAQRHIVPRTPGHALYEAGLRRGLYEAGDEFDVDGWRCQAFRDGEDLGVQHVAFCPVGRWDEIRWVKVDNATHEVVG